MYKIRLFIPCLLFGFCAFSQSAKKQSAGHTNVIKLGVNTFFETDEFPFYINWETKVGPNESLQVGLLPRVSKYDDDRTSGIGASVAFRKYISKHHSGISGLFISPIVKLGFLNDKYSYSSYYYNGTTPQYYLYSRESKISQFSVGAVFGHNWVFKSGFSFEGSAGFGYYNTKEKYKSNGASNTVTDSKFISAGIFPQLQINFGYAF